MLTLIFLTFVLAFGVLFLKKFVQTKFVALISLLPFSIFLYLLSFLRSVKDGFNSVLFSTEWIPSLGINLDFKIDGLSLLFGLLISGIGTLVYLYASSYLRGHPLLHRFICYLTVFMGAMLGVVTSDNLITLFIFWELTSISSFFLIGFNNEEEESRTSALWALAITGLGGFFLLSFGVIVGTVSGTYSIHELLGQSDVLRESPFYLLIIIFLFIAAFTKSAQFPFHFWLPGAMKAPTPVSAYLHSATMVKAGVYLVARFTPILGGKMEWNTILLVVGGVTMLFGAFHSVFRKDMKGILAYSTISALGLLMFLLGIGTQIALYAMAVFVLAHALYKAAFFLITGIIDHALHTRDINELGGLRKYFPLLSVAAVVAALSCAGIPLTFGFIGKELFYESGLHYMDETLAIILVGALFFTNVFLTGSGFLIGIKPFFGKATKNVCISHQPDWALIAPPVVLGFFTLLLGVLPAIAYHEIIIATFSAMYGSVVEMPLAIWHGVNTSLLLSGCTIVLGTIVYIIFKRWKNPLCVVENFEKVSPKNIFSIIVEFFRVLAYRYTWIFHNGYLRSYLAVIIVFFVGLVGYKLFADVPLRVNTTGLSEFRAYELVVFLIAVVAIVFAINTSSRLTAIAATGVVGYCICLIFVFYGAPDLGMTQFAIDTLTTVLFILVLFKLPPFLKLGNRKIQFRDAVISIAFGVLISIITLQALVSPADKDISRYYAENVYVLAKGKNVVNVILVDFRGFDTMIETIVLSIAALGVFSMLKYREDEE
ncbi:hydrogen gas-evolving membrane-bound hydrogenase subunit E [Myroides odoratimimus]|uniref:hydrogen gas-evolving membrane-bound hydrogenase subunit E n=1 Tax=Myroides odoratimimus TaxID=76832 RepID=UPI00046AFF4A|nr:hydrogen gas-evolving membrane-bound hydrogenase subunit E [Myroides odoratimimus]